MEKYYFQEIFQLLFQQSEQNPEKFISYFNTSRSLIGFNYSYNEKKFTHLSDSFGNILGFNSGKFLMNGQFEDRLIHPLDRPVFHNFFTSNNNDKMKNPNRVSRQTDVWTKCRARHLKGFWKYLVFLSRDYWNEQKNSFNKIGVILDEHFDRNYHILAEYNGQMVINNISAGNGENDGENSSGLNRVSISFREIEVLNLIGQGLVAKEIADKLKISITTVITHRKNLIHKLMAKNTAELVKKASQFMLI